ncbi:MAG: hypothetical protein WBV82_15630 [Myxococcaceae bacterium]
MAALTLSSSLDSTVRTVTSSPTLRSLGSAGFGIVALASDARIALRSRVDPDAHRGTLCIEKSLDRNFRRASIELQVGFASADLVVFYGMSARDIARQLGRQLTAQDAALRFEVRAFATRDLGVDSAELVLGRRAA